MSQVQILAVGHALLAGPRGEAGGAPSKDSIWGFAQVGRSLVSFSGRRGGKLKFWKENSKDLAALQAKFKEKKAGISVTVAYKDVTKKFEKVDPTLIERIDQGFKDAKKSQMVGTRKMKLEVA